jgi:hypothetical protein
MVKSVYKGLKLQQAVVTPTRREHIYGRIEGAFLVLTGAMLLEIDMPRQIPRFKEGGTARGIEPLLKDRRQIGAFYRDSVDDVGSTKTAFLLVLQEESQFPLSEHPAQLHQSKNMVDTVMGIVVVRDERHRDSLRRLGVGRWVDQNLVARCRPNTVKLV